MAELGSKEDPVKVGADEPPNEPVALAAKFPGVGSMETDGSVNGPVTPEADANGAEVTEVEARVTGNVMALPLEYSTV